MNSTTPNQNQIYRETMGKLLVFYTRVVISGTRTGRST